jgi:hypothetical protein
MKTMMNKQTKNTKVRACTFFYVNNVNELFFNDMNSRNTVVQNFKKIHC